MRGLRNALKTVLDKPSFGPFPRIRKGPACLQKEGTCKTPLTPLRSLSAGSQSVAASHLRWRGSLPNLSGLNPGGSPMNAGVRFPIQVTKLIPRLASDHDNGVVATARASDRTLKAAGADWHDFAAACEHGHERRDDRDNRRAESRAENREKARRDVAQSCRDNSFGRLNERELQFVIDMTGRLVCGGEPNLLSVRRTGYARSTQD